MNKKAAVRLSLAFMIGVLFTVVGLFVFYNISNTFLGFLIKGQAVCDDNLDYYNNIVNIIQNLEPQKAVKEELVDIRNNCALIAFSSKKESFVSKPDKCFQKSCLCMCYIGAKIGQSDCEKAKYCESFEGIEEINGAQKINGFEEQVYINELNKLEISRIDNTIQILI